MDTFFDYVLKPLLMGVSLIVVAGVLAMVFIKVGDITRERGFATRIPSIPPKVKNIFTWITALVLLWFLGILFLYR